MSLNAHCPPADNVSSVKPEGDVDEVEDGDRARFSAQPSLYKSASHTTVGAHSQDHDGPDCEKGKISPDGLGESALPEDKREEALERAEQDWDVDPENPRNWSFGVKWRMAGITSYYCFISPVSSSMMAPALPDIQDHYGITNPTTLNMTLSIFLLAYALGPLLLGPLSEVYGRKWVLHISNLCFLAFNLACAFAPNVGSLIAFRFLAGIGGSAPVSIGGGVIGDLWSSRERANAMAVYTLGPLIGPAVGPVAGGFIAGSIGFKWIFIVIASGALFGACLGIPLFKETYAPVIRMKRARRLADTDPEKMTFEHTVLLENHKDVKHVLWINLTRPFMILTRSFICFILSLYMALSYGYYYLMFATFPLVFQGQYGFSTGIAGLTYLGPGIGFVLSTAYGAYVGTTVYNKLCDGNGGVGKPEYRIPPLLIGALIVPIGLLWYGWSSQENAPWIVPVIGSSLFAFAMMATFLPIQLYLVDAFTYAASAIAAATVLRSSFGFAFPLFGEQMFDALGNGGGYSLLAGLAIFTGIPFPLWIYYKGEQMRAKSRFTS